MIRFTDLNPESYEGAIVIVDIDGMQGSERDPAVEVSVKQQLRELAKYASVYLSSNSHSTARFWELARETGTTYIGSALRDPDLRVLQLIPDRSRKRLVVFGGKELASQRFAQKIGAEFVRIAPSIATSPRVVVSHSHENPVLPVLTHERPRGKAKRFLPTLLPYLELSRPRHWIANILVFLPLVFEVGHIDVITVGKAYAAFVVFCLAGSAVHTLEDILLVASHRRHPSHRNRPIARGAVEQMKAVVFVGMILAAIIIALTFIPVVVPIVVVYVALHTYYSLHLKHSQLARLFSSYFYVLRVIAGGIAAGATLSPLLLLTVFFWAFALLDERKLLV